MAQVTASILLRSSSEEAREEAEEERPSAEDDEVEEAAEEAEVEEAAEEGDDSQRSRRAHKDTMHDADALHACIAPFATSSSFLPLFPKKNRFGAIQAQVQMWRALLILHRTLSFGKKCVVQVASMILNHQMPSWERQLNETEQIEFTEMLTTRFRSQCRYVAQTMKPRKDRGPSPLETLLRGQGSSSGSTAAATAPAAAATATPTTPPAAAAAAAAPPAAAAAAAAAAPPPAPNRRRIVSKCSQEDTFTGFSYESKEAWRRSTDGATVEKVPLGSLFEPADAVLGDAALVRWSDGTEEQLHEVTVEDLRAMQAASPAARKSWSGVATDGSVVKVKKVSKGVAFAIVMTPKASKEEKAPKEKQLGQVLTKYWTLSRDGEEVSQRDMDSAYEFTSALAEDFANGKFACVTTERDRRMSAAGLLKSTLKKRPAAAPADKRRAKAPKPAPKGPKEPKEVPKVGQEEAKKRGRKKKVPSGDAEELGAEKEKVEVASEKEKEEEEEVASEKEEEEDKDAESDSSSATGSSAPPHSAWEDIRSKPGYEY